MLSGGSYLQGYNCQLAVDADHQVIVAIGVSNQSPEFEHLEPFLQRIVASAGALPDVMTMDPGYWSENNVNACADQGVDAYVATGRLPHGQKLPPKRGPLPRDTDTKPRMARKLRSMKGAKIYAQRKADCGTGERSNQGMSGFVALSVAGPGEGERRLAPDCRHPQPALAAGFSVAKASRREGVVIQIPPITEAGTGCSKGMRGVSPGQTSQGLHKPDSMNRFSGKGRLQGSPHRDLPWPWALCSIGNKFLRGGNLFGGAGEEGLGKVLGERGGYRSGWGGLGAMLPGNRVHQNARSHLT